MNVLLVGGAGYIGGALTDLMAEDPLFNLRFYDVLV